MAKSNRTNALFNKAGNSKIQIAGHFEILIIISQNIIFATKMRLIEILSLHYNQQFMPKL